MFSQQARFNVPHATNKTYPSDTTTNAVNRPVSTCIIQPAMNSAVENVTCATNTLSVTGSVHTITSAKAKESPGYCVNIFPHSNSVNCTVNSPVVRVSAVNSFPMTSPIVTTLGQIVTAGNSMSARHMNATSNVQGRQVKRSIGTVQQLPTISNTMSLRQIAPVTVGISVGQSAASNGVLGQIVPVSSTTSYPPISNSRLLGQVLPVNSNNNTLQGQQIVPSGNVIGQITTVSSNSTLHDVPVISKTLQQVVPLSITPLQDTSTNNLITPSSNPSVSNNINTCQPTSLPNNAIVLVVSGVNGSSDKTSTAINKQTKVEMEVYDVSFFFFLFFSNFVDIMFFVNSSGVIIKNNVVWYCNFFLYVLFVFWCH